MFIRGCNDSNDSSDERQSIKAKANEGNQIKGDVQPICAYVKDILNMTSKNVKTSFPIVLPAEAQDTPLTGFAKQAILRGNNINRNKHKNSSALRMCCFAVI